MHHILLTEILATVKNRNNFKKKYGENLSDNEVDAIFKRFNSQQQRLQTKDILKYNSLEDLLAALAVQSKSEKIAAIKNSDVNVIINNERMLVVEPLTVAASKKYGANTKWCVASNDDANNGFDYWFADYSLVFLIDKIHNRKYAIAFNPNLDEQGWDEKNDDMNVDKILGIFDLDFNDVFDKVTPKDYPYGEES